MGNNPGSVLAEPIKIGQLELENRIVKASMVENMASEQGEVTDRLIQFYQRQAGGGAGLLITGGSYVQKSGRSVRYLIGSHDDALIPGLKRLSDAVHQGGGRIALQIYHCGRQTQPEMVDDDVIAPSPVRDRMTGIIPRAMTGDEIEETINAFAEAGKRAKDAGFDGVEVMAAHGYLISQFLSGRTNRRTDQWGGSLENRARFLFRITEGVRSAVGDDFPLLVKLNTEDRVSRGFTVEESAWVAERLPDCGVDAIKLSGGTFESGLNISRGDIPAQEVLEGFSGWQKRKISLIIRLMQKRFQFSEAYFLENAKRIKPRVRVPVILVGGFRTPAVMEQILRDGYADLIAIGRPLIREPEFPQKILSGDPSPASCLNCNRCFIRIAQEKPLLCYAKEADL
jgi:2,4-dienoyl-CoA reductase-like NADH-dependent reductase (Old Yellow Enzyme family)